MKKNEWIRVISLILILCIVTVFLSKIFVRKKDIVIWNDFYAQDEDSIDIVVIGSSLLACAIDPYQLSKDTGCTTFNFAIPAQSSTVHAAMIREIMKTQHPKLIIIESYRYTGTGRMNVDEAIYSISGMKPSLNKYSLIVSLPVHGGRFNRMEVLIPLLANHSRWESLTAQDFKPLSSNRSKMEWWKAGYKLGSVQVDEFTPGINEVTRMDDLLYKCLLNTVSSARENEVTILFFNPPNPELKEENYGSFNAMYQYLDEQGVDWVECNYDDAFVRTMDTSQDYCDYHHVNILGAEKTTEYLADYINSHYDFEGQFDESMTQYQDYLRYREE